MILNAEQLAQAMHGWVDKEEIDGYTAFFRFTKKQRDYYATTVFASKEKATAGQYLEFFTDASAVRFEYKVSKASSQSFYYIDYYVNGTMVSSIGKNSYDGEDAGLFEISLPEGENAVKIYFPNLNALAVRNVELENAATFRSVRKKINYVAYGDSITHGYNAVTPSLSYMNLVAAELDAEGYNLGIGGEIFEPQMLDEKYPVKADVVTVAYGTNDWSHTEPADDEIRRRKFFEGLLKIHKGAKIFVLLPIWRGNGGEERIKPYGTLNDYRDMFRKELEQYPEITVIEGIHLVPNHPNFYAADVLHPNALGFTQYAKNLLKEMKKHM